MTIYREKLWPAPWLYISTALVMPASLLVFLPINLFVGVITAIALYAGCVALLIGTTPAVTVTDEYFFAGRARLPLRFVGEATAFTDAAAALERGQHLDARAWMLIRGWINPVVRVNNTDESDPVPYWLVSTRRPDALVGALADAKQRRSA